VARESSAHVVSHCLLAILAAYRHRRIHLNHRRGCLRLWHFFLCMWLRLLLPVAQIGEHSLLQHAAQAVKV
jgi:hypothetical protein